MTTNGMPTPQRPQPTPICDPRLVKNKLENSKKNMLFGARDLGPKPQSSLEWQSQPLTNPFTISGTCLERVRLYGNGKCSLAVNSDARRVGNQLSRWRVIDSTLTKKFFVPNICMPLELGSCATCMNHHHCQKQAGVHVKKASHAMRTLKWA